MAAREIRSDLLLTDRVQHYRGGIVAKANQDGVSSYLHFGQNKFEFSNENNECMLECPIHLDKADHNTIYGEITVYDHALTRPLSITRKAIRNSNPRPVWRTETCPADNTWVRIGNAAYYMSADGNLMPTKKDQAPPDLKYFKQPQK